MRARSALTEVTPNASKTARSPADPSSWARVRHVRREAVSPPAERGPQESTSR